MFKDSQMLFLTLGQCCMQNRGVIKFRERKKQILDFSGIRFGNITPTDIDVFIEYHNKCYVIIEVKYGYAEILFGQKLALERMCDDFEKVGKPSVFIISRHEIDNPEEDVKLAKAIASKCYFRKKWTDIHNETTEEVIRRFIKKYGDNEKDLD